MVEPKRISVHHALGSGLVADVLLWKNWRGGVAVLGSATTLWYLFEQAGYNFLSFVANVILLLVVILFLWAKAANLLNRPLPPLPDLEISEETIARLADVLQIWINRALSVAHDIAIERNLFLCLQVVGVLWIISYIGSLFNFLTLIYICVLLSLSLPILYDKYQDQINEKMHVIHGIIHPQYQKIHSIVLSIIPKRPNKDKKVQ
ncbi:reticulon-like protein B11 [Cicer arietinum]|uniref:Reticulon-like protein n=1 Tax=Cicer arietinum TaxID=3827 RepID=A0A1S2XZE3_CICAR|nr:reticulon-like protein B11 [Cicer arietinum]XP_004496945.1 reticulon-like protein B11 [Cicer arietinum]XP_004496946.1 reticulon-like protein B11 [Cicer arietinum]XP_027189880.1 reticulon-like protein B11 [Cicer arietinum]